MPSKKDDKETVQQHGYQRHSFATDAERQYYAERDRRQREMPRQYIKAIFQLVLYFGLALVVGLLFS